MAALTIPERYRDGIAAVGKLTRDTFNKLFEALKESGQAENAKLLAERIRKRSGPFRGVDLEKMISALAAIQEVKRSAHVEPDRFASDVWEALLEDSPELTQKIKPETLKSRIAEIVTKTDIHLTSAKIRLLQSEVERAFCGVRVLTDLRAAFSDDASKIPAGATILHTLEIKYHDDMSRHREFYVAMDDKDLETLKDAIDRAQQKRKTLASMLAKSGLEIFD